MCETRTTIRRGSAVDDDDHSVFDSWRPKKMKEKQKTKKRKTGREEVEKNGRDCRKKKKGNQTVMAKETRRSVQIAIARID